MMARDIIDLMDANGSLYPFAEVRHLLAGADIAVANMEGAFSDRGVAANKLYTFRTPPRHARGLAQAGIDVVALGNNHAMDFGDVALQDTLDALDSAGVARSGAGINAANARAAVVLEANGLRVAFLSYNAVLEATFAGPTSAGVARAESAAIQADVAGALDDADVVVVSLHAGTEYTDVPTGEQRLLARAAIDAGAALVLGSHAHVLQGWERYAGGMIVYSLGNFVFDLDLDDLQTLGPRPFQTIVFEAELSRAGVENPRYTPVFIDPAQNRPLPANAEQAGAIERRMEALGIVR
jgi:poly-gamma-glutamate synthesis protein (capsule biosynthesis protein)